MNAKEIVLGVGFDDLRFGMSPSKVEQIMGTPTGFEEKDADGDKVFKYQEMGIDILCFDHEEDFRLTIIEVNPESFASLWGVQIFNCDIEHVKELADKNGYRLRKGEIKTHGIENELFQIRELCADFYFTSTGSLENISMSVLFDNFDHIKWPIGGCGRISHPEGS